MSAHLDLNRSLINKEFLVGSSWKLHLYVKRLEKYFKIQITHAKYSKENLYCSTKNSYVYFSNFPRTEEELK